MAEKSNWGSELFAFVSSSFMPWNRNLILKFYNITALLEWSETIFSGLLSHRCLSDYCRDPQFAQLLVKTIRDKKATSLQINAMETKQSLQLANENMAFVNYIVDAGSDMFIVCMTPFCSHCGRPDRISWTFLYCVLPSTLPLAWK